MVLNENSPIKLLNTINEKCILLKKMGLNNLVIHPFDKEFSNFSAEEFIVPLSSSSTTRTP
jgi:riboflavin kinase/FMN adenylyltransferase